METSLFEVNLMLSKKIQDRMALAREQVEAIEQAAQAACKAANFASLHEMVEEAAALRARAEDLNKEAKELRDEKQQVDAAIQELDEAYQEACLLIEGHQTARMAEDYEPAKRSEASSKGQVTKAENALEESLHSLGKLKEQTTMTTSKKTTGLDESGLYLEIFQESKAGNNEQIEYVRGLRDSGWVVLRYKDHGLVLRYVVNEKEDLAKVVRDKYPEGLLIGIEKWESIL